MIHDPQTLVGYQSTIKCNLITNISVHIIKEFYNTESDRLKISGC